MNSVGNTMTQRRRVPAKDFKVQFKKKKKINHLVEGKRIKLNLIFLPSLRNNHFSSIMHNLYLYYNDSIVNYMHHQNCTSKADFHLYSSIISSPRFAQKLNRYRCCNLTGISCVETFFGKREANSERK